MATTTIVILVAAYVLIWIISATVFLALEQPNARSLKDADYVVATYGIAFLWPAFAVAGIGVGISYVPYLLVNKFFQGTSYIVRELKNPKENV